jgi:ornithine decarboxylase
MLDPKAWLDPLHRCAQIMAALAKDGIYLEMVDVGGGFPVPYAGSPPPIADYANVIRRAASHLPYRVQLACEPGRAIAAPAGTMVATVIGAGWRGDRVRVSLDVGAFHGMVEALESDRELRFPVTVPEAGTRASVPCMLTGPSCDSRDTILDHVVLPMPRAGDQVLISMTGAYTTCYSGRSSFNRYPAPSIRLADAS